jgi:hypothetical protein
MSDYTTTMESEIGRRSRRVFSASTLWRINRGALKSTTTTVRNRIGKKSYSVFPEANPTHEEGLLHVEWAFFMPAALSGTAACNRS